jgi:hypothetical protein
VDDSGGGGNETYPGSCHERRYTAHNMICRKHPCWLLMQQVTAGAAAPITLVAQQPMSCFAGMQQLLVPVMVRTHYCWPLSFPWPACPSDDGCVSCAARCVDLCSHSPRSVDPGLPGHGDPGGEPGVVDMGD